MSDGHRGNSEKSSETGENLFSHRKPQSREREICKITNNRDNQNGNHQHENRDQIENRNNKFWLQNNLKFAGLYFLIEKFKQMKWKNKENCKSKKQNKKVTSWPSGGVACLSCAAKSTLAWTSGSKTSLSDGQCVSDINETTKISHIAHN